MTRSRCILAHVRAATQGLTVQASNCHPFRRGELAFMHNGDIGGFEKLRRALLNGLTDQSFDQIRGSTDSEHLFALICDRLDASTETDPLRRMVGAMRESIARVRAAPGQHAPEEFLYLNLVLSDGTRAVAARYTTDAEGGTPTASTSTAGAATSAEGRAPVTWWPRERTKARSLVASEPLSRDEGWEKVPVGSFVTVDSDLSTDRELVGV
ncbi:MAG: class II glutamine amidotransferase [Planctomycetota bacterium]